ncbi:MULTISPECIES: hypothetical protein [Peptoniphilaceae]|uniref:hypothetical protein n=1 Tax=Peptoniphilaceae TaxID=1570339 RepID=UPI0004B542BB|nr:MULTISPECIES: hypothetical protein [Peptoniphilaceae]
MEQMACPVCKKRFFDVSRIPLEKIKIAAKCPHCGKISTLEISNKNKKKPYRAKK